MAASAMNGALFESTMNVFFKMKYARVYDAALATPLTSGDIALGEISYATIRGALYSVAFLITMWALGMTGSVWSLAMVPVAVLVSFAFSAVGMAGTTYMRTWADFEYVPSVMLPMFLFSATFYPLSSYGDWQWLVQISPLYHGVAMTRGAQSGRTLVGVRRPSRLLGGDGAGRIVGHDPSDRTPAAPLAMNIPEPCTWGLTPNDRLP